MLIRYLSCLLAFFLVQVSCFAAPKSSYSLSAKSTKLLHFSTRTSIADSQDNTFIVAGGTIHLVGNAYGISSGHLIVNGIVDQKTHDVIGVLFHLSKIYQQTTNGWLVANQNPPPIGAEYLKVSAYPRGAATV